MEKNKHTFSKGIICISLILLPFINGFSQQISRQVIASAGDYFSKPSGSLSWTIGEDMTETFSGSNAILTQGFQQVDTNYTIGISEYNDANQFSVYPNPGSDHINISFNPQNPYNITITLYDVTGRLIKSAKTTTAVTPYNIDISGCASNCYFLSIHNDKSKLVYSTIVVKP